MNLKINSFQASFVKISIKSFLPILEFNAVSLVH